MSTVPGEAAVNMPVMFPIVATAVVPDVQKPLFVGSERTTVVPSQMLLGPDTGAG